MGQKVNPVGFRTGLSTTWNIESQCYGKGFKNSKIILKKTKDTSTFIKQYFKSQTLISGKMQSKIFTNYWQINTYYVSMLPKLNPNIQDISNIASKALNLKLHVKYYNITIWFKMSSLLCEFIKNFLKKGTPFRKIIRTITRLALLKHKHKIICKTSTGSKLFQFTGLKIRYTGRFGKNRNRMANSSIYKIGTISLQSITTYIEFYEIPVHTKQGTCNLQVWIAYKSF